MSTWMNRTEVTVDEKQLAAEKYAYFRIPFTESLQTCKPVLYIVQGSINMS